MPSPIEAKFQEIDNPFDIPQPPTTDNLVQFGYNFFGNPSAALAAVQNIPVGNDYIIGPGDEIDILMWGRVNTVLNPTVDRNGMIQVTELRADPGRRADFRGSQEADREQGQNYDRGPG